MVLLEGGEDMSDLIRRRTPQERLVIANTLIESVLQDISPIESRHGLLLPDVSLPSGGCYKCMFREGNLCRFLPASVPVVECGKRNERHKECPLIEV